MCIDALKFCLKNCMTHGVLLSAVVDVQIEVLDELLEGILLQVALVRFGLGYGGDEGSKESEFHVSSLLIFIFNRKITW